MYAEWHHNTPILGFKNVWLPFLHFIIFMEFAERIWHYVYRFVLLINWSKVKPGYCNPSCSHIFLFFVCFPRQGDSGGPLQCKQGSVWVQAGILSFGLPCATVGFPEVYSRVSEFHTWVSENVRGAEIGFVTYLSSGTDTDTNFKCNATVSNVGTLKFSHFYHFIIIFTTLCLHFLTYSYTY